MATKTETAQQKSTPTTHGGTSRGDTEKPGDISDGDSGGGHSPEPTPEAAALQAELDDLGKPGRVGKADAEFIDNAPGYSKDQLAHMREYYGISKSDDTADVAPV